MLRKLYLYDEENKVSKILSCLTIQLVSFNVRYLATKL